MTVNQPLQRFRRYASRGQFYVHDSTVDSFDPMPSYAERLERDELERYELFVVPGTLSEGKVVAGADDLR